MVIDEISVAVMNTNEVRRRVSEVGKEVLARYSESTNQIPMADACGAWTLRFRLKLLGDYRPLFGVKSGVISI